MIKAVLFDWGNTLMLDFPDQTGPMYTWNKVEAVRNAELCLSILSKEFPCYLATNAKDSAKKDINKALFRVNIEKYITDIFCYTEIGYEKPSSEFFKCIFEKLSLAPQEMVLIGDDIEKDFKGARQNGVCGILFDPEDKYTGVEFRVNDLLDTYKIIKSMDRYIA